MEIINVLDLEKNSYYVNLPKVFLKQQMVVKLVRLKIIF